MAALSTTGVSPFYILAPMAMPFSLGVSRTITFAVLAPITFAMLAGTSAVSATLSSAKGAQFPLSILDKAPGLSGGAVISQNLGTRGTRCEGHKLHAAFRVTMSVSRLLIALRLPLPIVVDLQRKQKFFSGAMVSTPVSLCLCTTLVTSFVPTTPPPVVAVYFGSLAYLLKVFCCGAKRGWDCWALRLYRVAVIWGLGPRVFGVCNFGFLGLGGSCTGGAIGVVGFLFRDVGVNVASVGRYVHVVTT